MSGMEHVIYNYEQVIKQAGADLGQAQLKLWFGFTSIYFYQIDELHILLARLTPTAIFHWTQVEKSKSNFKRRRFGLNSNDVASSAISCW